MRIDERGAPPQDSLSTKADAALDAATAKLKAIVGDEHVLTSQQDVARYSRCTIPWDKKCAAIVFPASCQELCEIVEAAREFELPLWPVSRGLNWGYGTTMAVHDGAIILILERLNRVIEVNEELAYAVIEPGVSYRQLNDYLKERNIKLWIDCTDGPADASVMGNALERGIGETPYGDHFGNICGMEVLLPSGDLVRTGDAAFGKSKGWNTFKWGTGPYVEGLFSQSNFGIVTKIGMWLMPEPEAFTSFVFEIHDAGDLPSVIDAMRRLALNGAIQSKIHMINDFVTLAIVTQYPYAMLDGQPCLSDEALAQMRHKYHIAPWSFGGAIYGSPAQVRAHRALLKDELRRYGRLTFMNDTTIRTIERLLRVLGKARGSSFGDQLADSVTRLILRKPMKLVEVLPHTHAILKGIPSDYFVTHSYFKWPMERPRSQVDPVRDNLGLMWAGVVVPLTGHHLQEVLDICRPLYRKHGFDLATALILANPRAMVALMSIFFDKKDAHETARALALYYEMGAATAAAGYQQYRTTVAYMDRILEPAPTLRNLLNAIKSALDPHSILAPGRYGIGFPGGEAR